MITLYISNGNSSLTTQKNGLLKQVWSLCLFDTRPRQNDRAVFPHSAILFYSIFLCPASVFTNLKIVENSDTKDILSPGRYIFIHVGVLPFLPLLVPTHHNQQGREGEGEGEHGNFYLSFISIKSPANSPSGLEILTSWSVVTNAFWMRIVDTTLRRPANRDFL